MSNQKNDTAIMQSMAPKNFEDLKRVCSLLPKQQIVIVNLEFICDAIIEYIKSKSIITDTNHRYIEKWEDGPGYLIMPPRRETAELDFTGIEVLNPKCMRELNKIKELLSDQKVVILNLDDCYEIVLDYLCSECGIDPNNVKRINKNTIVLTPVVKI